MLKTSIMTSIETSSAIGTETGCDTATERGRQEERHRRNIIVCPPVTLSQVSSASLIRPTSSVADDAPPHERHLTTLDITFDKEAHRANS